MLGSSNLSSNELLGLGNNHWAFLFLVITFVLELFKGIVPEGLNRPPEFLVFPFADWINFFFVFLRDDLGLIHVSRAISGGVEWLLDITANLLYGKHRWPRIGPIPWSAIAVTAFVLAYSLGGWKLSLVSGGTFIWIAVMGQWKWAMETLSVIIVATPISVLIGLIFGTLAWRSKIFERILNPILNVAQTMPHFAYMIQWLSLLG